MRRGKKATASMRETSPDVTAEMRECTTRVGCFFSPCVLDWAARIDVASARCASELAKAKEICDDVLKALCAGDYKSVGRKVGRLQCKLDRAAKLVGTEVEKKDDRRGGR